jgi:hypothetical protein
MLCRVNVSATLEEQSIHIEDYAHPNALLYAAEGEDPSPVAREAWKHYMRGHPECPAGIIYLRIQTALPRWRLRQVATAFVWLVEKIIGQRE